KKSELYTYDAIEMITQYLGLIVDEKLLKFVAARESGEEADLTEITDILLVMDRLLLSHPNRNLKDWLTFARKWGNSEEEQNYYESNARRLLTTWGGDPVNDYAGRVWSGLIRDYYVPRWHTYHADASADPKTNMRQWEENWVMASGVSNATPYADPVAVAIEMFKKHHPNPEKKTS
ncbi:MAG: alpha-N-acetylglucosaminidase C-terminal domain-containing protein, partial [Kordiimonas sp.]